MKTLTKEGVVTIDGENHKYELDDNGNKVYFTEENDKRNYYILVNKEKRFFDIGEGGKPTYRLSQDEHNTIQTYINTCIDIINEQKIPYDGDLKNLDVVIDILEEVPFNNRQAALRIMNISKEIELLKNNIKKPKTGTNSYVNLRFQFLEYIMQIINTLPGKGISNAIRNVTLFDEFSTLYSSLSNKLGPVLEFLDYINSVKRGVDVFDSSKLNNDIIEKIKNQYND